MGQAQQKLMEYAAEAAAKMPAGAPKVGVDTDRLFDQGKDFWADSLTLWQRFFMPGMEGGDSALSEAASRDRRFSAPQWGEHPLFDLIRQSYLLMCEHMFKGLDAIEGLEPRQKQQMRFAMQTLADALSPSNFPATNPLVLERIFETRGDNLIKGIERMTADLTRGQLTHTDPDAFEVGRNIAMTPGKVVYEAPLFQLIQYAPTTARVQATPLVIFPPWINRFYILDLNPRNSFVRWAVEQGLTVFMVSWKSADASIADVEADAYALAQIDAIERACEAVGTPSAHAIGYCVAGTTLAMTLSYLAARGEAAKVASATFFTAQVDFADAGDLLLFVDDRQIDMLGQMSAEKGFLDGRYMAATFNLLRGRDLIWSYVVNNYLLGQDYPVFDLLHWNGDTTNLPAGWHRRYLSDFYRDNLLVQPGALSVAGVPIDLTRIETPAYVQAGREDHIAPAASVWKMTEHLRGPLRFVLAGSGHIAGVVNPPAAGKYQYWTHDGTADSLEDFIAGASETKGSWWPDWLAWISEKSGGDVPAKGGRIPGKGPLKAIEDAPGRYVRER
ncbi:class I poly(R)-hydroxyalkanoic acid synthase [Sphingomonas naphthae]|uniref:Class I poly(R)-hydroxyalkanoic acid synthase n=1 Tax=Sphingomonas naphthae TaxID=1813468 RepID=A0ABY7TRT9_9SPHN|nr:class I poly(R)-hydroxyalkanoic acid synthase [Sphingomonas naphthae]WCT75372.1 class I poly(R)-hydroxyalkanoic acid synthase [Sphingomonas naphthae]